MTVHKDFLDKNGNYDLLLKHVADKKLRRIIDIGAWWGPWSLFWHPHAEKLEIFEPNKKILPKLEHNISTYNNCTLHKTALGEYKGTVSMEYDTHSGTNHVTDNEYTNFSGVNASSSVHFYSLLLAMESIKKNKPCPNNAFMVEKKILDLRPRE